MVGCIIHFTLERFQKLFAAKEFSQQCSYSGTVPVGLGKLEKLNSKVRIASNSVSLVEFNMTFLLRITFFH